MSIFKFETKIITPDRCPHYAANARQIWTPSRMPTLVWIDAADRDSLAIVGTDEIAGWYDKSGNNNNLTANTRPIYVGNVQNGLGITRWSYKRMNFASNINFLGSNVYVVAKQTGTGGQIFSHVSTNIQFKFSVDNKLTLTGSPAIWGTLHSGVAPIGVFNIYRFEGHNSPGKIYINGALSNSGGTQNADALFNQMGVRAATGEPMYGDVAEAVITTISAGNIDKIEGYLAHKWGLTSSLPAGHPYKIMRP